MKVGLVLEGGAMRGMYTAGVLDYLMDKNLKVDGIVGTSAGALFGINYFSNQKGRAIRYNKKYALDPRYISPFTLVFTGNIVSKNFAYYKMSNKLDPFDNETFIKNNKDFYAVVTNVETGKAEYLKLNDPLKEMEVLRATSSMPLMSRIVKINGKKYLDGGVADSIPIDKFLKDKYDKIIVVLTQPLDYKKEPLNKRTVKMTRRKYKKYPKFIKRMENRYKEYNKTLDKIKKLEEEGRIFVLRPHEKIKVGVVKKNKKTLQEAYDIGTEDIKKNYKKLKEYLKS